MSILDFPVRTFIVTIALGGTLGGCSGGGGDSSPPPAPISSVQFGTPVVTPLDDFPRAIAYGDFDGDGRKDAVVALWDGTGEATRLAFLRGKADGSFEASRYLAGLALINDLAAVDLNRNGLLDLVVLGCTTNPCSESGPMPFVFLGNGAGAFTSPVGYATGLPSSAQAMAVGDFNGDGVPDLMVGRTDVALLLGNGDGTFKVPTVWRAGDQVMRSLYAADFTGDGKLDPLSVFSSLTLQAAVVPGNGNGEFGSPVRTPLGTFVSSVLDVMDLNRDGKADLLVHREVRPAYQYEVRLSNGDGSFADGMVVADGAVSASLASVALGDLDRNGVPDLLALDTSGNLAVRHGKGDGTFLAPQALLSAVPLGSMDLVDLNGDGRLDLVIRSGKTLVVLLSTR